MKFSRSDLIVYSLNSNLKLLKNPLDHIGSEFIPINGILLSQIACEVHMKFPSPPIEMTNRPSYSGMMFCMPVL